MKELIISKEELVQLFESKKLLDTGKAWIMDGKKVDIIALHDVDPKFLQDITNSKFYKLVLKGDK